MAQVRGYLLAIRQQECARDAQLLSLVAIATRANNHSLEKTLDRLLDHAYQHQD